MNIIERNYLPKLNTKETQQAIITIDNKLIESLKNKMEITMVRQPLVSSKKVAVTTTKKEGNRQINFDSSNDNIVYYIYNDYRYWLVNTIHTLDIKNNNAIGTFVNYINRDLEIKNTQTMECRKLMIEYRFDNDDQSSAFSKADELNKIVYDSIKNAQSEIIKKFPELKDRKLPASLDEKELKKVSSKTNINDTLADIASDEGSFILKDKRDPSKDLNVENTFEISMYSFKKEINEAYRIYKISDRRTIQDIEPFTSESESIMEEYIFGKEALIKGNDKRTINIEIDLDALGLLLLGNAHILELQSGNSIEEIERILSEADIKHL